MRCVLPFLLLAACGGGPALQNAPRPNPSTVAGLAAGAAAAATLADPDAAARKQEQRDEELRKAERHRGKAVHETVPAAVLDRLDEAEAHPGTEAGEDAEADAGVPPP